MNPSLISSAVSMQGLQQKLDTIANNMANVDTTGFKRKEVSFSDILTTMKEQPDGLRREGRLTPLGFNQGWGARLANERLILEQGSLKETNHPLDWAITGDAFFEVDLLTERAWTRDGSFSLSVDTEDSGYSYITTKDGYYVRDRDDQPIRVPANHSIKVEQNGVVMGYDELDPSADPIEIGQLKLVRIIRPQSLDHAGDNLYKLSTFENIDDEQMLQIIYSDMAEEEGVSVQQGFLEQSNVNLSEAMAELLLVQRAYQLNARALQSADSMMNMANNLRG